MAQQEEKRTAHLGAVDRDIDDRLLEPGKYRDALNINVGVSESGDVGAIENLKGNELVPGQTDISGTTIGYAVDPDNNRVYWFTEDDNKDGLYEFEFTSGNIVPILLDSRDALNPEFTAASVFLSCQVSRSGAVTVVGTLVGTTTLVTTALSTGQASNVGTTTDTRDVTIMVDVTAPATGFSNSGATITVNCVATQLPSTDAPATALVVTIALDGSGQVGSLLTANPSGGVQGTAPTLYLFSWTRTPLGSSTVDTSFSATTQSIRPTESGTYTVTVTDFTDPTPLTATANRDIAELEFLDINVTGEGQVGSTLEYEFGTGNRGTSPYTQEWVNIATPGTVLSTALTFTPTTAGTYQVTVTDSTTPTALMGSDTGTITAALVALNVTISGISSVNRIQTANVTGGRSPFSFQWSLNGVDIPGATAATFTPTAAGTYRVTVTDSAPTPSTVFAEVTITDTLTLQVNGSGPLGSQLMAVVSGGTPAYTFSWAQPGTTTVLSTNQNFTPSTTGVFRCTVTDSTGATASADGTIAALPTVIAVNVDNVLQNSLRFNAIISDDGGSTITSRGFYILVNRTGTTFSASEVINNPNSLRVTEGGQRAGSYNLTQTGLEASTRYNAVAWADNNLAGEATSTNVIEGTTAAAGVQSITFNPDNLTGLGRGTQSHTVETILTNLPDSTLTTSISYQFGGTDWISQVRRVGNTRNFEITVLEFTSTGSGNSPTRRAAVITFTNPGTGITGQLSVEQGLGASLTLSFDDGGLNGTYGLGRSTAGLVGTVNPTTQEWQLTNLDSAPSFITFNNRTPNDIRAGMSTQQFTVAEFPLADPATTRQFEVMAQLINGDENTANAITASRVIVQNKSIAAGIGAQNPVQEITQINFLANGNVDTIRRANGTTQTIIGQTAQPVVFNVTPTDSNGAFVVWNTRITPIAGIPFDDSWVTVTPTTGVGGNNQTINVSVSALAGMSFRAARITLTASPAAGVTGSSDTYTINVVQNP